MLIALTVGRANDGIVWNSVECVEVTVDFLHSFYSQFYLVEF